MRAWNRSDAETLVEMSAPEIEVMPVVGGAMTGTPYRGHEGIRQFVRDYDEVFEEFELEGDDVRGFDDRVAWLGRVRAKGRDSGVELDQPFGMAFEFRHGKAIRFRSFLDHEGALKAAQDGET